MFSLYLISAVFQSFSPKKSVNLFIVNSRKALILLAFLFLPKLTRRFNDFLTVFCCFQHFFMLFLSWRPWFYWVGGSPTFFTEFLTIFVLIKEKAPVPSPKTEASFEYLNHTYDPAFAVHPCSSPIFCHQEDKSELRGATPNFLPRLTPKPAQEWLPANFTVHSEYKPIILPYGYFHRLLPL